MIAAISMAVATVVAGLSELADHALAAESRTAQLNVTWSGYDGVSFGEALTAAARTLHGTVASDAPRSNDKFLAYPGAGLVAISGSLRSETESGIRVISRSGPDVGGFLSRSRRVRFPDDTHADESLTQFKRALGSGIRPERPEPNGATGYYLVGPHGRTVWAYGDSRDGILVIGLAESLAGARHDWNDQG